MKIKELKEKLSNLPEDLEIYMDQENKDVDFFIKVVTNPHNKNKVYAKLKSVESNLR